MADRRSRCRCCYGRVAHEQTARSRRLAIYAHSNRVNQCCNVTGHVGMAGFFGSTCRDDRMPEFRHHGGRNGLSNVDPVGCG